MAGVKTVAWSLTPKQKVFLEKMKENHKVMLKITELTGDVDEVLSKGIYTREQREKFNTMVRSYKKLKQIKNI